MFVPSKTFGMAYGDSWFDLAEKQKLLYPVSEFTNSLERWKTLNFLYDIDMQISSVVLIVQNF